MYTGHSTAALALRAKCSFYYFHLPLSTDYYYGYGSQSCLRNCIPCSQSSLCAVPRSPRLIYYGYVLRRHSPSLFQLQPSRALLVPRRTVRVCDGGGFDEVIGLLAEPRRCCRCCGGEGFAPEDGDLDRYSRKEGAWGDGPRSRYGAVKNSSFSGEFEGRVGGRRRVVGESSRRGGKKGYGIGRVDVEEKVVREIRRREDDGDGDDDEKFSGESRNERGRKGFDRGIWEKEGNVASWRDSGRETREEDYAYEEPRVRNGRASSSRREVSELRSRIEDENIDDRMSSGRRRRKDYVREEQDGSQKLSGSSERNRYEFRHESNQNNMDRGESSDSVVKQQSEVDKQVVGQADSGKSSLRASNVEKKSNSQRRFEEERMRDREERSTSVKNFFGVKGDERTQIDQKAVDKVEVNELYETRASDSRFRGSDTERAESSKSYLEIRRNDERKSSSLGRSEEERMKYREDKSTSVENLVRVRRDERTHVNQQAINKMESNEQYEIQINSSRIHCSSTERVSNAKSSLQTRADNQEEHSTSVVDLVHGVTDSSRVESEWDSFASEFRKSSMERVSNLQEVSTIRSENENESSSSVMVQDKKDDRQRSNLTGESLQSTKIQMGISESLHGSSSSVYRVKNDAIETASRYDESSAMYVGEFVNKLRQEALTSDGSEVNKDKTHREAYQETSTVELGVDDITRHRENYIEESGRQSSSRSGMKGPSDEMWEVRGMSSQEPSKIEEEPEKQSPAAEVVDSNTSPGIAENAITRRSHRSLWTYIANIMNIGWAHRAGSHSSTKKSGTQSLSNESTGSEAWFSGHESDENDDETEKKERDVSSKESVPLKKPAVQSKVDVSASMDTTKRGKSSKSVPPVEEIEWSEGGRGRRESSKSVSPAEEIEWSKGGRGRRGTLSSNMTIDLSLVQKGNTTSSPLTETQKDQMHRSNSPKSEEDFGRQKQTEVIGTGGRYRELKKRNGSSKVSMPEESNLGPSTSVKTMRRASSSKGFNLVSGPEDFESTADDNGQRGILSDMDQSSILTAGMVPPSIPEIETIQMADRGMPKLEEVTNGEKLPEVGGTEGTEGELKRRKFQRNKQVMKEQFEEWEEAYKRESEQQKVDEFFMREALLEAKKAADTWEVPVGAVLVHKGKIIARGCNLVEELRDSTAHAEMICIREASNLLRTWRLAETTLYVTLEPCPMCAGAILQARIDTVVWGAPNKLLGADGSWVRLFPNRDGGGSSLDPANQTAGPVHPFHTKITIRRGILAIECADAMQQFFQLRRKNKKQERQPSPPPSCLPISAQPTKLLRRMHDIFSVMFCL